MRLKEWVDREGSGALTKLMIRSGLAYSTVFRAVRGQGVSARTAEKISAATDGDVSPAEVIFARQSA